MSLRLMLPSRLSTAFVVPLAALTLACSGPTAPTSTNTPTAAKPTSAPAASSPAASPAVPAASPAASPAAAASGSSSTAAAAPGNPNMGAGSLRFVFEPGASEIRYRARETFADQPTPAEAVGSSKQVSGSVTITSDGAIDPEESKVMVDLSTLASDRRSRDAFIKQNTLQTSTYPNAELVMREVTDLLKPLPAMGTDTFQLLGDLTVHGVTRPVQWDVQAQFAPDEVTGTATTRVKITDFGMQTPRTATVLSVEDELRLELDFRAQRT